MSVQVRRRVKIRRALRSVKIALLMQRRLDIGGGWVRWCVCGCVGVCVFMFFAAELSPLSWEGQAASLMWCH